MATPNPFLQAIKGEKVTAPVRPATASVTPKNPFLNPVQTAAKTPQPPTISTPSLGERVASGFGSLVSGAKKIFTPQTLQKASDISEKFLTAPAKAVGFGAQALGTFEGGAVGAAASAATQAAQGKFSWKKLLADAEATAKATGSFGQKTGEIAGQIAPFAIAPMAAGMAGGGALAGLLKAAPLALDAFLVATVGKSVYDVAGRAGTEYEQTKSKPEAFLNALKDFGAEGWKNLGADPETAKSLAKNNLLASAGIAINTLFAYWGSTGVSTRTLNKLAEGGNILKGERGVVSSEEMTRFLKEQGAPVSKLPPGEFEITKVEPTVKGRLLQPVTKALEKPKVRVRFKPAEQIGAAEAKPGEVSKALPSPETAPSVVQVVNQETGAKRFYLVPKEDFAQVRELIDGTTAGIAGKVINGESWHITASTPEKMKQQGFTEAGTIKPADIPKPPEAPKANPILDAVKQVAQVEQPAATELKTKMPSYKRLLSDGFTTTNDSWGDQYWQVAGKVPEEVTGKGIAAHESRPVANTSIAELAKNSTKPVRLVEVGKQKSQFKKPQELLRFEVQGGGDIFVVRDYVNVILRNYPDAVLYAGDEKSPLAARVGDRVVGVVMPIYKGEFDPATVQKISLPTKNVSITQKELVKRATATTPKTIKQVAEETNILEPNVRRILGVGAKDGTFERVDKGVYRLNVNGQEVAFIETGDALEVLPRLVTEGFKADMVFLDIPYKTPALVGGNRGIKEWEFITPEQFKTVMSAVAEIVRTPDSAVFYMFSKAPSGQREMDKYTDVVLEAGFKPIAAGEYTKLFKTGALATNPQGKPSAPEGIMLLTKSGSFPKPVQDINLDFRLVRPKGWQTEKPAELARALVELGTNEGETVLDPFAGSGVVPAEAVKAGRKTVAIEKSKTAVEQHIKPRIQKASGLPSLETMQEQLAQKIEETGAEVQVSDAGILVSPKRAPSGEASSGATTIGKFEKLSTKESEHIVKLHERVQEIIKKYAERVGEGYLPRGAAGVHYPATHNIRVSGMNDLSVAAHEVTHYLDHEQKLTEAIILGTGHGDQLRRQLTQIYLDYYPSARVDHPLVKRIREGLATLLQKYVEMPSTIESRYPTLVQTFFKPDGKFYAPKMASLIADLKEIVIEYQGLKPLDKIGARVTSTMPQPEKDSFFSLNEKVTAQAADAVYPIAALAKRAGIGFTIQDPSIWLYQYNNIGGITIHNITKAGGGYYSLKNGEFVKLYDFNWRDLMDDLVNEKVQDSFGFYLVARRVYFGYQALGTLKVKAAKLAERGLALAHRVQEIPKDPAYATTDGNPAAEEMMEMRRIEVALKGLKEQMDGLKRILTNDGITEQEATEAYVTNKERFKDYADKFDKLTGADLELLHDQQVQLVDPQQYAELKNQEGYAPFKRNIYDEIVGSQDVVPAAFKTGKKTISSMLRRKGGQQTIINPVYGAIQNHFEVVRKAMRQVVYNKIVGLADQFPEIFQRQQTKPVPNGTGGITYPQEKDPHIISGRRGYKRVFYLVDSEIKQAIDDVLTPQNIGLFAQLWTGAARLFTKGTTGLYAPFAVTNFAIDQWTAAANARQRFIPLYDPLKEMLIALTRSSSDESKYLKEYLLLGGERQTFVGWLDLTPEELFKKVTGERKGLVKALDYLNTGMDVLAWPAKMSELMTRAVEYVKMRKAGHPQLVAMEAAGQITAPFHHVGKLGGAFGKLYVKSIPYFNPGIQVLAQMAERLKTPQGRRKYAFVVTALAVGLVTSLVALWKRGTEEQKRLWKDITPQELAQYFYYPNPDGKTLGKVRIPQQLAALGTVLEMAMAERVLGANFDTSDYADAVMSSLPQQFQVTEPGAMLMSWLPQVIKPAVEVSTNKRSFPKLIPLVGEGQLRKPSEFRFTSGTSPLAKAAGATGLAKALDLSPIQIDYLLQSYLGRTTGLITGKLGLKQAFGFKNVMTREPYLEGGRQLQQYYDLRDKTNQQVNAIRKGLTKVDSKEEGVLGAKLAKIKIIEKQLTYFRNTDPEKDAARADELTRYIYQNIDELINL